MIVTVFRKLANIYTLFSLKWWPKKYNNSIRRRKTKQKKSERTKTCCRLSCIAKPSFSISVEACRHWSGCWMVFVRAFRASCPSSLVCGTAATVTSSTRSASRRFYSARHSATSSSYSPSIRCESCPTGMPSAWRSCSSPSSACACARRRTCAACSCSACSISRRAPSSSYSPRG